MKLLKILPLLLINCWSYSQGLNNLWVLGYDNPFSTPWGGMTIDFSSGIPNISSENRLLNFNKTNGIISDASGNFLFASNGIFIENAAHDTMVNGSGLNPSPWTNTLLDNGLTLPQGNLVIPIPSHNSQYYVFHLTIDDYGHTYGALYLYYSIIDMSFQGGLGEVVQKNQVLQNDTLIPGFLTACKHSNGRDWWITCHQVNTNVFYKFLITPYSILGPFTQAIGEIRVPGQGQNQFSPNGKHFAYYEPQEGDLDIFDFDRCSGLLSLISHININDTSVLGGVAFSPNSQVLYVTSNKYVFQFDVTSSNIASTMDTVAIWDGYHSPVFPFATLFFLAQLAPDGKIYITCGNGTLDMHVIENPDILGDSCNVCQHCVHLLRFNASTIPNYPNYFLGAESNTICDSLVHVNELLNPPSMMNIFPNPATNEATVSFQQFNIASEMVIENILGQEEVRYKISPWTSYQKINLQGISKGLHVCKLINSQTKMIKYFIKE